VRRAGDAEWTDVRVDRPHSVDSRGIGLADMAWAMRTGRPHRASGSLASHCVDVMQSFIESAEAGRHIELASTTERPAALPADLAEDTFDD
jgi:hypothetical protein